jgi:predicted ATPase
MSGGFQRIAIRNYRALANVDLELRPINVFFGPNATGKSTLLDSLLFVRDCIWFDCADAAAQRSQGVGLLSDHAGSSEQLLITLRTVEVEYQLAFSFAAGRLQPLPKESLARVADGLALIERRGGDSSARFVHDRAVGPRELRLTVPEKLALSLYLALDAGFEDARGVASLEQLLQTIHFHHCRLFDLYRLKRIGSEAGHENWLLPAGENLFSVLRNLQGRQSADNRYEVIRGFMRAGLPGFTDLILDATGPTSVYASFLEAGHRNPIHASGTADGYLQMLLVLAALFAEEPGRESVVLLDEPETSLHPWALAVLAQAVKLAASDA